MSRVRLRALVDEDIPVLDGWARDTARRSEFADFGLPPLSHADLLARVAGDPRTGFLVVEEAGRVAGSVSWQAVAYGPNPQSRAWNIGIELDRDFHGRGVGTTAQRLLADMLFATTDAGRVEASTDVENLAEQRALEKAGFRREGVLRGAQWRGGRWHDLVGYARVRAD
ncbi:RimJ/RimL family protein N-acetyltransferase [Motilibacter rhizosphaerae]|uniref:RimJ/RimL family protein N-acetyltransferase n=1 Tax=Motilibacter rhizosphaerae TaxID=598652 RepID=A0A4Q7NTC4_9ACTN|nr:GNAT family protein [Motilibacter rhizosphaerae]RZS90254.1 RimJ/RimL family protein N-acetyltransferase [Motilibacter rhizosphaerae]